jgi:hypothetical protein
LILCMYEEITVDKEATCVYMVLDTRYIDKYIHNTLQCCLEYYDRITLHTSAYIYNLVF